MDREILIRQAWKRGLLEWKLKPHQKQLYTNVWNAINGSSRRHVLNCSRRFGKSFVLCLIAIEFAIRKPKSQIRIAAPTQKQLEKILHPHFATILEDCPDEFRPKFSVKSDVYTFPNKSEVHLAGCDAGHAESLRGMGSHLNIVDEAGSIDNLRYVLDNVLSPLTLTTSGKTLIASTPPVTPAHDYSDIYRQAKSFNEVSEYTIYDNTSLTEEQFNEAVQDSGGIESTTFKREYLVQFVTDADLQIIPEWNKSFVKVIDPDQLTPFYHKYVALDTGVVHLTAAIYGYYNFMEAKLYIEDETWMNGPKMTTELLSEQIKTKEKDLWGPIKPYRRIADSNNLQLINDLTGTYGLNFIATSKTELVGKHDEGMINKVRVWVRQGKIIVNPKCEYLIGCLTDGIWKHTTNNSTFAYLGKWGHADHLAALVYLVRNIDIWTNPIPPDLGTSMYTHHVPFDQYGTEFNPQRPLTQTEQTIGNMFPGLPKKSKYLNR